MISEFDAEAHFEQYRAPRQTNAVRSRVRYSWAYTHFQIRGRCQIIPGCKEWMPRLALRRDHQQI